jgi:hypothetical protein
MKAASASSERNGAPVSEDTRTSTHCQCQSERARNETKKHTAASNAATGDRCCTTTAADNRKRASTTLTHTHTATHTLQRGKASSSRQRRSEDNSTGKTWHAPATTTGKPSQRRTRTPYTRMLRNSAAMQQSRFNMHRCSTIAAIQVCQTATACRCTPRIASSGNHNLNQPDTRG